MSTTQSITGRDYLAFLADPIYWPQGDQEHVYAEGVVLDIDGQRYDEADIKPGITITEASAVTIVEGSVFRFFDYLHSLRDHYESWAALAELRRKGEEYNDRLRANGVTLLPYVVPCCGNTLESRIGPDVGQWDTMASCPHCGSAYMKISTSTAIIARTLQAEAAA